MAHPLVYPYSQLQIAPSTMGLAWMCGLAKGSCSIIIGVINIWRRRVDVLLSGIWLTAGIRIPPQLPTLRSKKPRTHYCAFQFPRRWGNGRQQRDELGAVLCGVQNIRTVDSFENPIFRSYNVRGVCIYHIVYYMYIYPLYCGCLGCLCQWNGWPAVDWNGMVVGRGFCVWCERTANRRRNGGHIK